jgi:hypothetical protein
MTDPTSIARSFLSMGIQSWGQSVEKRAEVTRNYLKLAGFGEDGGTDAAIWLANVVNNLHRGEFHDEVRQLETAALSKANGGNP